VANVLVSRDTCLAHSEPYLASNPHDSRNLLGASKCFSDPAHYRFRIASYASFDSGATWHANGPLDGPQGYAITSDTTVAFSSAGVGYVAALAVTSTHGAQRSGVYVWRTQDGGRSFAAPVPVFESAGFTNDKPWLAIDTSGGGSDGTLYVAWVQISHRGRRGAIGFGISRDGGHSFTGPVTISGSHDGFAEGPVITVGPQGQVRVVYEDTARRLLEVVGSPAGGSGFGAPRMIARAGPLPGHLKGATFRITSLPAAAVDSRGGTLYVAWTDYRAGHALVLSMRSVDDGRTWLGPVALPGPSEGTIADAFMPQLAVGDHGTLYASYFGRGLDPSGLLIDEFLARSIDGGASFGPALRITSASWDPAVDAPVPSKGVTFIGDYQGLAVDRGQVFPFWNDTRTGRQDIFTAAISQAAFGRTSPSPASSSASLVAPYYHEERQ
jgi:hypothetical protein